MSEAKRIQIKLIEDGKEIISAEGREYRQRAKERAKANDEP